MHSFSPTPVSHLSFVFSVLALGAIGFAPAHADVKYTSVMSFKQGDKFTPMNTTTTWLKDGLERTDTKQSIGAYKSSESAIVSAKTRNRLTFDPALKIYTLDSLNADGTIPDTPMPVGMKASGGAAGTGKIVMTLAAKFLGLEKLMDYQTRHNVTTMAMDTSGCCGVGKSTYKTEDWRADIKLPTLAYKKDPTGGSGVPQLQEQCKITLERKGDVAAYEAAQKGLALKSLTFDGSGKAIASTEITMLSFAALGDNDFAAPAGFKKVTRAAYDQARQKAMMDTMMKGGMGGAMGQQAAFENDDEESAPSVAAQPETQTETTEAPTEAPTPGPAPEATPDTSNVAQEAGKNVAKNKLKKKFKLPF